MSYRLWWRLQSFLRRHTRSCTCRRLQADFSWWAAPACSRSVSSGISLRRSALCRLSSTALAAPFWRAHSKGSLHFLPAPEGSSALEGIWPAVLRREHFSLFIQARQIKNYILIFNCGLVKGETFWERGRKGSMGGGACYVGPPAVGCLVDVPLWRVLITMIIKSILLFSCSYRTNDFKWGENRKLKISSNIVSADIKKLYSFKIEISRLYLSVIKKTSKTDHLLQSSQLFSLLHRYRYILPCPPRRGRWFSSRFAGPSSWSGTCHRFLAVLLLASTPLRERAC